MDKEKNEKLRTLVKNSYNDIAESFSKTRRNLFWPEIDLFCEKIKDRSKILDAGCGNGRLLNYLKNKKIKYLGIDNSENLLKEAEKNYQQKDFDFKLLDVLDLEKLNEKNFDYIFFIAVLHHLPDEKLRIKALIFLKNKLQNSGEIFLTAWNLWSSKKHKKILLKNFFYKIFFRKKGDFKDLIFGWQNKTPRYYHAFTSKELKKIVKLSGLKIIDFKKDQKNYYLTLKK